MIQLSVGIITHDEEKNIERCLNSVREVADDIVVVDFFFTENKNKTLHLNGNCFHYSYYSVAEHYKQAEKYSDIAAKDMHAKGKIISYPIIFLKTVFKFHRNYFFKLGFLDGRYGYIICKIIALETYLKYSKLYKLNS